MNHPLDPVDSHHVIMENAEHIYSSKIKRHAYVEHGG